MTEQERQHVIAVLRALRRSYDVLREYLREHPSAPELLQIQVEQFTALQNLKPLLAGEMPDEEWPDTIGE
jgi:hypothetical protein